MKSMFLAITVLLATSTGFSRAGGSMESLYSVPSTHEKVLNAYSAVWWAIKADMEKKADFYLGSGGTLRQFSVEFDSLKCLDAQPSEMEPQTIGVCVVPAYAFQISTRYAIIVSVEGISVKILSIDVE